MQIILFLMNIKIHEAYRSIVAVADSDLIGKVFEEGIKQIDVRESFFKGEEVDRERVIEILKDMDKEDAIFNIVGKKSVECGIKAGVLSKEGIIEIDGIPIGLGLF